MLANVLLYGGLSEMDLIDSASNLQNGEQLLCRGHR